MTRKNTIGRGGVVKLVFDMDEFEDDPWVFARDNGVSVLSHLDFLAGYEDDQGLAAVLFSGVSGDEYEFDIAVAPRARRQGLANELMDIAIENYETLLEPFPDLVFSLDVINHVTKRMLEKRGFRVVGGTDGRPLMTRNPLSLWTWTPTRALMEWAGGGSPTPTAGLDPLPELRKNPVQPHLASQLSEPEVRMFNALEAAYRILVAASDSLYEDGADGLASVLDVLSENIAQEIEDMASEIISEGEPLEVGALDLSGREIEQIGLEDDFAIIYHDWLEYQAGTPTSRHFENENDLPALLRHVAASSRGFLTTTTDAQLIEAAQDAYESQRARRRR